MTKSAFDELPEQASDVDATLEEAATATEPAPAVKERKPRTKTEKAPKLYPQWNEDGSPQLDEEGKQVQGPTKMAKPKKAKAPKPVEYELNEDGSQKLDEEGNPIVKKTARGPVVYRVPKSEGAIIHITDDQMIKVKKYQGARGQYAAPLADGQTIGDYLAAGGDRGFLRFYIKDGACTVSEPTPA